MSGARKTEQLTDDQRRRIVAAHADLSLRGFADRFGLSVDTIKRVRREAKGGPS